MAAPIGLLPLRISYGTRRAIPHMRWHCQLGVITDGLIASDGAVCFHVTDATYALNTYIPISIYIDKDAYVRIY